MSQNLYIIDTSSFIAHKKKHIIFSDEFPRKHRMSAVVLQELVAGLRDSQEVKAVGAIRLKFERDNKIITPDSEDWFMVGKILFSLANKERSKYGKAKGKSKEEINRIVRDSLIARTAKRDNAVVITENVKDFELIKPYCNIEIVKGSDYFS
jgi:predicted nucleic acid-binding protein